MAGKTVVVDINKPERRVVYTVSSLLKQGKIVVYPSDTVYGILADAFNKEAVDTVKQAKGYTKSRPFIVLVENIEKALQLSAVKEIKKISIIKKYLYKSVTVVLVASEKVPDWLVSHLGTIAIRIPSDPLSQQILNHSNLNLISTSANLMGEPFPLSSKEIPDFILNRASLFLDGGDLLNRTPSQIFDLTGKEPVQIR